MAKRPPGQQRELFLLAGAMVLAMSPWFSTAAVLNQLRGAWGLTDTQASWLTIVVQVGFVIGAVGTAATNLADRLSPRRLVFLGATGAAVANFVVVFAGSMGSFTFSVALLSRLFTGVFLAAVYPPALKAVSAWYKQGRGFAFGVMIGALTIGSALPHLINAVGGLQWQVTLAIVSALTLVGGTLVDRVCSDGPYTMPRVSFDPTQLKALMRNRKFQLASAGYFGHMWELYAMWAWISVFYSDVFESPQVASFAAFAVIASGAAGSVYAGLMSDQRSRSDAAALAMRWSASAAVVVGFLIDAPTPIVLGIGLIWGFWVVADSAQFSAIVTEVVDLRYVGTALTIQLATGFVLTVFTIFLVPVVRDAFGWGWAFFMLAPGPMLGAWAMRVLRVGPKEIEECEPEEAGYISPFF